MIEKIVLQKWFCYKSPTLFVKFKFYGKNVTLFSGTPIFHQIIVSKVKMQFWQLWPHICAKRVELLISTNLNWWKKFQLFEKNTKIVLWRRKMQFRQQCSKKVSNSQTIFSIKSKIVRTNRFFPEFFLSFRIAPPCKYNAALTGVSKFFTNPTHRLLKDPNW